MALTRTGISLLFIALVAAFTRGPQATAQESPGADLNQEVPQLAWEAIAAGELSGMAVAIDIGGDLVYSEAFGRREAIPRDPVKIGTSFAAAPLADLLIATAAMRMVEAGALDLDADLGTYLPAFEDSDFGLNLHYLLSHTSGLPPLEEVVKGDRADVSSAEKLTAKLAKGALDDAPGTCFRFTSSDTFLAGMVLMEVSGKGYEELMREQIFDPAEMKDCSICDDGRSERDEWVSQNLAGDGPEDLSPAPWLGGGCFCATVSDLVAFQRALVDETLVSKDSWASMARAKRLRDGSEIPGGYGLQIAPLDERDGVSIGGAALGARMYLAFFPTFDLTIAIQAFGEDAPVQRIGRQVAHLLLDIPMDSVEAQPLSQEEMERYTGIYQVGCTHLEVRLEEGGLIFDSWQRPNLRLTYLGEHCFAAKIDPGVRLTFELSGGVVSGMVLEDHGVVRRAGKIS